MQERIDYLKRARDYAEEAIEIFSENYERSRLVQAYIELGCIYRYWIEELPDDNVTEIQTLTEKSRKILEEAITQAGQSLLNMKIDAQINLALLGLSTKNSELFEEMAKRSHEDIPTEYHIIGPEGKTVVEKSDANYVYWRLLSKLHKSKGDQAFWNYTEKVRLEESTESSLEDIAQNYFWCLEYMNQFPDDSYRDRKKIIEEICDNVKRLKLSERDNLKTILMALEDEHGFKSILKNILIRRTILQKYS